MREIRLNIVRNEDLSYSVFICSSEWGSVLNKVVSSIKPTSVAIVTDTIVSKLHLRSIVSYLPEGINYVTVEIPAGEKYKTRKMKEYIEDKMLKFGVDRKGLVIAFGGGVVGDIGGFVAATYMRGIPFIQVPTTLLSMIDSSIGGKVAVDTPYGKNMIGSFYQPKAVVINVDFLKTLPSEQIKNGLAEVIKHAIIADKNFFDFLLENRNDILELVNDKLEELIEVGCSIKKKVVESDEKESGLRKILNFGHTVGHAIESVSNYKILHGFAVSVGMVIEAQVSNKIGILPKEDLEKIKEILSLYGLPTSLRELKLKPRIISDMVRFMRSDKKSISGEIHMSLPKRIGEMIDSFSLPVEESLILSVFRDQFI